MGGNSQPFHGHRIHGAIKYQVMMEDGMTCLFFYRWVGGLWLSLLSTSVGSCIIFPTCRPLLHVCSITC